MAEFIPCLDGSTWEKAAKGWLAPASLATGLGLVWLYPFELSVVLFTLLSELSHFPQS